MTNQADILGRPPKMKPRPKADDEPVQDWTGEHLIRNRRVKRIGNKFSVQNAQRKAYKRRKA